MQLSPRPPCTGLFWLLNKKASALLHPESTKIHSPTPTHSLPSKLLQITPPKPQRTLPCGHQQTTRITREGGRVFNLDKDENLHGQNIRNPQPRYTPTPSQLIYPPNNNNPPLSVFTIQQFLQIRNIMMQQSAGGILFAKLIPISQPHHIQSKNHHLQNQCHAILTSDKYDVVGYNNPTTTPIRHRPVRSGVLSFKLEWNCNWSTSKGAAAQIQYCYMWRDS